MYKNCAGVLGAFAPDEAALREADDALALTQSGDNFGLACALIARGVVLVHRGGSDADLGLECLERLREMSLKHQWPVTGVRIADIHLATHKLEDRRPRRLRRHHRRVPSTARCGPARRSGSAMRPPSSWRLWPDAEPNPICAPPSRPSTGSRQYRVDPTFVLHEVQLLRMRALLARAHGDEVAYREFVERYRTRAAECGHAGHVAIAEAM